MTVVCNVNCQYKSAEGFCTVEVLRITPQGKCGIWYKDNGAIRLQPARVGTFTIVMDNIEEEKNEDIVDSNTDV